MKPFLRSSSTQSSSRRRSAGSSWFWIAFLVCCILLVCQIPLVRAQLEPPTDSSAPSPETVPAETPASPIAPAPEFALPQPADPVPTVKPPEPGQYVLEFNRSPIVGTRLRLESIYDEARLQFTRPRNWQPKSVKALVRFRHSPALYATRSNLTLLVNGTSVGSVPLNQPEGRIANVVFEVPPDLIQDYNELTIAALQNNSPTCTQDPYDPSLWSEIMPDSKLVFEFDPQPIALDLKTYPYPLFDVLSLESNQITYLQPQTVDETWLTASSRLQSALGRVAQYRRMDTRLRQRLSEVEAPERLIVIGTPTAQPALADLELPLVLRNDRFLDGEGKPLPDDVGVLMWTTTAEAEVPVLVVAGNGAEGVSKAVQFLVQSDRQIGTGNLVLISAVTPVPTPPQREWNGYLPVQDQFALTDLRTYDNRPYSDITVRGSNAPALEFDFRALPDDHFLPGSFMTLSYSYGPQVNPLTSLVEVELDGVALGGKRLASESGANRETLRLEIPPERIKPNSRMQINFRLDPRERRSCSRVTDQQLWGTVHADTSFNLKREQVVEIPDLKLLQFAYPFAAPQDLSNTAIVLPDRPQPADLLLMLKASERLGRLSRADSVQLATYRSNQLPEEQRRSAHLIAIGTHDRFPLAEAFDPATGFTLGTANQRQWQQSQVQTQPDTEGMVKEIVSPWNTKRVLLAFSSQTNQGLNQVSDLLSLDPLFYQIEGDTVLISANRSDPSPYNEKDYTLQFLTQSPRQEIATENPNEQLWRFARSNWYVLAPGLVAAALILYGVAQLFLKKLSGQVR